MKRTSSSRESSVRSRQPRHVAEKLQITPRKAGDSVPPLTRAMSWNTRTPKLEKFDAEIQRLRVDIGNGQLAVSVLPVRVHAREQLEDSDEVHYFSPNIRRNRPVAPMLLP